MASVPRVYLGGTTTAQLYRTNEGFKDGPTSDGGTPPIYTGGVSYGVRARGVRVAPSGPDRETAFREFLLVVTHTMAVTVRVTPILDGVPYDGTGGTTDERVTIVLSAETARVTRKFVIGLSVPVMVDALERARVAQRGTWFEAMVETVGDLAAGDLLFEENILSDFEPAEETTVASS